MLRAPPFFRIEDFASSYIRPFDHFDEVKEEDLASAFREFVGLPEFPAFFELVELMERAAIDLKAFVAPIQSLPGANVWHGDGRPAIYIDTELARSYQETTLCHELREVIEQAFQRVKPSYVGIETHNNHVMNPRSDRFASNLLMPREATQQLLAVLGFDLVAFAIATGRSLPSVMMRAQDICSARSGWGITAGVWLFQQPWNESKWSGVSIYDSRVQYRAHLRGFSTRKAGGPAARLARSVFPRPDATIAEFEIPLLAFQRRRPVIRRVDGFDLFGPHNYLLMAEPLLDARRVPWRILAAAVRLDFTSMIEPWLARLSVGVEDSAYQAV